MGIGAFVFSELPSNCEKRMVNSTMKSRVLKTIVLVGASVLLVFSTWQCANAETPGQRFDRFIKEKTAFCKQHRLTKAETTCDILKLKPYDPLATPEGRFAHSIAIPNPVPVDSGYRVGMSPKEYFKHLCEREAGNFVFRSIQDVEGITQLRVRSEATDEELEHLYAMEDPYGYTRLESVRPQSIFVSRLRYAYLDSVDAGQPIKVEKRFSRHAAVASLEQGKFESESRVGKPSRYGYTWRGISRPHDRALGIAGGELIVLDLYSGEILGVRRGFIRSGGVNEGGGIWWLTGQVCPAYDLRGGRGKDFDFQYWFIGEVLRSKHYERSFVELGRGK